MSTRLNKARPFRIAFLAASVILVLWRLFGQHAMLLSREQNPLTLWQGTLVSKLAFWSHEMTGARHPFPAAGKGTAPSTTSPKPAGPKLSPARDQMQDAERLLLALGTTDGARRAAAIDLYRNYPIPEAIAARAQSSREIYLWRVFSYRKPVSVTTADSLRDLSARWKLGWFRDVLLAGAYQRAGSKQAAVYRSRALAQAQNTVIPAITLIVAMIGGGVLGFVLSILVMVFWRSIPRIPSPLEGAPSLPCLEAAAIWILVMLFAGSALKPLTAHLSRAAVLPADVALELVIGVAGIALMRWWLRVNGAVVQLPSRRSAVLLMKDAGWGIAGYFCLLPWMFGAALLSKGIFGHTVQHGTPDNPVITLMAHPHGTAQLVLIFVLASVLAPVFEERFFRGAIYPALRRKMPVWAAACLTGAVFAGIHPQLPLGFLPIFVIGAGFCVLYEMRGTTASSIVAHSLNNTMVFVLLLLLAKP